MSKAQMALLGWQHAIRQQGLATEQQVQEAIEKSGIVAAWLAAVPEYSYEHGDFNRIKCGKITAESQWNRDEIDFHVEQRGIGYLTFSAARVSGGWEVSLYRAGLYPENEAYDEYPDGVFNLSPSFYSPMIVTIDL